MNWLRKLPGHRRAPPGLEWRVLRLLPSIWLAGTVLPALGAWSARRWLAADSAAALARAIQRFDFMMLGLAAFIWSLVIMLTIGCLIVWLMKGPAYVADGYEVPHSDRPRV